MTSPGISSILILAGAPSKRVNAGVRLDAGQAKRLHPTSTIFSLIIAHILANEEHLAHALLASHLKEATFSDTNVQSILRISLRFSSPSKGTLLQRLENMLGK